MEILKRLPGITFKEIHYKKPENQGNPFNSNGVNDGRKLVDESGLKVGDKPQIKHKRLDSDVIEDMQRQLHITDPLKDKSIEELTDEDLDRIITPEHKESMRKIKELLDD